MPTVEVDNGNDRSIVDEVIELIEPLVQPYCDDLGNPCIELLDVKGQSCWPLRHKRVKTWIQAIYYRTHHKSISAYDLRNILNELEDRAWAEPSRIPFKDVAWKVLDRHAVGQSIIFLVSLCQSFEGYTKDLLAKLVSNGVIDRLKMAGMQRRFPLSMVAFADRVLEVKSCLQAIGIEISISNCGDGSYCIIKADPDKIYSEPEGMPLVDRSGTKKQPQPEPAQVNPAEQAKPAAQVAEPKPELPSETEEQDEPYDQAATIKRLKELQASIRLDYLFPELAKSS